MNKLNSPVKRLVASLSGRFRWWDLGVIKLRSSFFLDRVSIQGQKISLSYPEWDVARVESECRHLYWDDPYALKAIPASVRTVLDVGANIGFFSLLARHYFPDSAIHAYEPNPRLAPYLLSNTSPLKITVFAEGIGGRDGFAEIESDGNTLTSTTKERDSGAIKIASLHKAVERLGGTVDLLKMDCEGAEWLALEDTKAWSGVRRLALEYHLFGGPERTLVSLVSRIKQLGFRITYLRESGNPQVGLLHAEK